MKFVVDIACSRRRDEADDTVDVAQPLQIGRAPPLGERGIEAEEQCG